MSVASIKMPLVVYAIVFIVFVIVAVMLVSWRNHRSAVNLVEGPQCKPHMVLKRGVMFISGRDGYPQAYHPQHDETMIVYKTNQLHEVNSLHKYIDRTGPAKTAVCLSGHCEQ